MNSVAGKNILFISPRFFNYEVSIKNKLEELGAKVFFYDERPNNKISTKVILRLFSKGLNKSVNRYYDTILEEMESVRIDFLFIIKGEATPSSFLENFKVKNRKARLVYYLYDSVKNNANAKVNFKYFDKVFSFDKWDVVENPILRFRPLFFLDEYAKREDVENVYDISFIGTAHSDRYNLVKNIIQAFKSNYPNLRSYIFFYCQSKGYYRFRKIFDKDFRNVLISDLSFVSLKLEEVSQIFAKSKCIIDIQHPNQTGLTMRTIEALGAGKKLITTNKDISKYDFYDSRNILIVDRESPKIPSAFLSVDYVETDHEILKRYMLKSWIEELFEFNIST